MLGQVQEPHKGAPGLQLAVARLDQRRVRCPLGFLNPAHRVAGEVHPSTEVVLRQLCTLTPVTQLAADVVPKGRVRVSRLAARDIAPLFARPHVDSISVHIPSVDSADDASVNASEADCQSTGETRRWDVASPRHAVPIEAKSGASVVLERDGAAAVFAPWRGGRLGQQGSFAFGGGVGGTAGSARPDAAGPGVHQEDTAGLAAVHLVQALVLVSVGAQEPEAAGPAQQRNGAHAEPGGDPSGRPLLALSEAPPVTPSGPALARDDSTTADANDGPLLALPGWGSALSPT